jgi:GDP-4-dehydro-6-deoxy-D-mannose reductase
VRALITGASGFAGGWLCDLCVAAGDEVLGISRSGALPGAEPGLDHDAPVPGRVEGLAVDLRDGDAVSAAVRRWAPEVVYHLAALSSVGRSWSAPADTIAANVGGAVSLLEAIRLHAPDARVVWVSTSELYGTVAQLPIAEDSPPAPESPYGVSKLAGEQLASVYAHTHEMRLVIARPFSHSGPRQRPIFLMSNIARQAAAARRAGARSLRLTTGNADVRRDFTDVRDVVRAYRLLASSDLTGIFNVCSGVTRSTAEQVTELARQATPLAIEHVVDPALVRDTEVMELRGDHSHLTAQTGWAPTIPYAQTLADTLAHWDRELADGMRD